MRWSLDSLGGGWILHDSCYSAIESRAEMWVQVSTSFSGIRCATDLNARKMYLALR